MKVILEYAHWHGGTLYRSGSVLDLDDSSARWLIAKGLAEAVEDEQGDAHIAGDAQQPTTRRPRGKPHPSPALPTSGEGVFAPPPRSGGGREEEAVSLKSSPPKESDQ
jgi:hypothetical protein